MQSRFRRLATEAGEKLKAWDLKSFSCFHLGFRVSLGLYGDYIGFICDNRKENGNYYIVIGNRVHIRVI